MPVEELTDIMHFDVLQQLGQGSNGAVFKVGFYHNGNPGLGSSHHCLARLSVCLHDNLLAS